MPPFGRGGAGNIKAITQENARISADLEANQSSADNALNAHAHTESDHLHRQITPQQYANIGRGGAGNLVDAKDLEEPAPSVDSGAKSASMPGGVAYGRGGAGNQEFSAGVREGQRVEKEREEQVTREKLTREIEKGVRESLATPAKARTAGDHSR